MAGAPDEEWLDQDELADRIDEAFEAHPDDDEALREGLAELASHQFFDALSVQWAPRLYRRDRSFFLTFIRNHFSRPWGAVDEGTRRRLEAWLDQMEPQDVDLYRQVYEILVPGWGAERAEAIGEDLTEDFLEAETAGERERVLRRYDLRFDLTEEAAETLYRRDPEGVRDFLIDHIPTHSTYRADAIGNFAEVRELAAERGDRELQFAIYRRVIPRDEWEEEVELLVELVDEDDELCDELERRHPEAYFGEGYGHIFQYLLEERGEGVFPYVKPHLTEAFARYRRDDSLVETIDLARRRGWLELWATLIKKLAGADRYNAAVAGVLEDGSLGREEKRRRLGHLTGPSWRSQFGGRGWAHYQNLELQTAGELYEAFPELFRRAFLPHLQPTDTEAGGAFVDRIVRAGDTEVLDDLASKAVIQNWYGYRYGRRRDREPDKVIQKRLRSYYASLLGEPERLARRASDVLGKIEASKIWKYDRLVGSNPLAGFFFEQSDEVYLASEEVVRELLEASNIHVQALGYRVLGQDDQRAGRMAADNVEVLQAALFRRLHKETRARGLGALVNAARHDAETAEYVVDRARRALDLPDKAYPKDDIIAALGAILARYPALRTEAEQPVVYEWSPAR